MGSANIQGELWGARANDWAELGEPPSRPGYEAVFARTGVRADTKLLDIGCGAGTALVLARSLGADVVGLDAAHALVELARLRVPGARVDVGEMEDLPFPSRVFDVVTGFNAFQFASNPVQALREARRVCKHRGFVAAHVWGRDEYCESHSSTLASVLALLPEPAARAPRSRALSEPGVLEASLEEAKLTPIESGNVDVPLLFPDAATAWRFFASAGVVEGAVQRLGEDTVKKTVLRSFDAFTRQDGSLEQSNRFHWVIATPS